MELIIAVESSKWELSSGHWSSVKTWVSELWTGPAPGHWGDRLDFYPSLASSSIRPQNEFGE